MPFTELELEYYYCAKDPLYYINKYGYVFDAKKSQVDKMTCFGYQETCLKNFYKNKNNIVLKSRQTGLSVITAAYVAWRVIFYKDEKVLIVANDGDGAERFLATVKQFIEYTPKWLLPGDGETVVNNTRRIQLKNNSWVKARASSPNAGRGDSITLLVLDETAFIDYAEEIWTAAGLALSATNGKCIMISTPQGTANLYHSTWVEAKERGFEKLTVHWSENPYCAEGIEERVNSDGEKVLWSPWYEEQCKRYNYDPVKISQELDLSFEGSKRLAIENALVSKYEKRLLTEEYKEIYNKRTYFDYKQPDPFVNYETDFIIFKKPDPKKTYLFGGDVARGGSSGGDFSTLQVLDIATLEIVAEYRGHISPDLFAKLIYIAGKAYNWAYLAIEANTFGLGTNLDLHRKMSYPNMNFCKNFKEMYVAPHNYDVAQDETIPGFQTTKATRPLIITNLAAHMREGGLIIYSPRTVAEFRTFIQNGDKPEAEKGKHDDLIIALAIALFIRDTEYKNAFMSKEMYKGMLEAISYSSGRIDGSTKVVNVGDTEKAENLPPGAGGIFFKTGAIDGTKSTEQNDNNLDWLFGKLI